MPPESNQNPSPADSQSDNSPLATGSAGTTISPSTSQAAEPAESPSPGVPAPAADPPADSGPTPSAPDTTPQVIGPAMPFASDALGSNPPAPSPLGQTPTTTGPASNPIPTPSVSPPGGGDPTPAAMATTGTVSSPSKRHLPVMLLVIVSALVIVLGGSAAAYFGYYMSSGTVWKDSLTNTGKGYDKLVSYLNTQSNTHYSGFKENGSFQVTGDGGNYNGSITAQSYNHSATASVKFDLGVTKIDLEARTVPAAGTNSSDIYLQLSGIKSLSDFLGPTYGPKVADLDGQWIVIDHNLLADLEQQLIKQQGKNAQLKWSDINSFLVAAGTVNQKYLFTTDANTSVTTIVKTYGKETVDGHKTYHYKVGFVKAHVKAYVTAMCGALGQSGLGTYIKQQTGQAVTDSSTCKDLENSTDKIKSSDTVDVWTDINHRLLYKVRISDPTDNPAQNFVDVGLNYNGGSTYPFFISGQSKAGGDNETVSVVTTLDSKANTLKAVVKASDKGSSSFTLNGNFALAPSNQKITVTAPANAKPITDVLNSLGLGDYLNELENLSSGGTSNLPANSPFIPATTQL